MTALLTLAAEQAAKREYPRHEGLEVACLVMVAVCLITAAITLFSQGHSNRR